jgi:SAM-dependent methyltransferase
MNIEAFTGRAQAYTAARPGYPAEAIEYIRSYAPKSAVFADIGAGTGKLTELIAAHGYEIFAVEPNADMRAELEKTLSPFPNARIVAGTAEATTLRDCAVDVIVNAQTLNRVDTAAFRTECQRIGREKPVVFTLFNAEKGEENLRYQKSMRAFYHSPAVKEFPNPVLLTRDKWLLYFLSMEGVPLPFDSGYEAYAAELNERFDRNSENGVLRLNLITKVYSEKIEEAMKKQGGVTN